MKKSLVVVQKNDHSLGIYDFLTGRETARIALDPYPHEFVLSRDRRYALQSHFGVALAEDEGPGGARVSIVDLQRRQVVGYIDCGPWRRPHGIALDHDDRLYVLSEASDRLLIATDPFSQVFECSLPTGGAGSHIVTVTGDGKMAFCSNMKSDDVSILDPGEPDSKPRIIPTGARPEGSVLDAAQRTLYVACRESSEITVIDVAAGAMINRIATQPGPVRLCWGHRGRLLVALYHARALAVVDVDQGRQIFAVPLPDKPVSIAFDHETGWALCSTLGDEVCAVDLIGRRVVRYIATRPGPDPVALIDQA